MTAPATTIPFATAADLHALTGYVRASDQKRWLDKNGVCYALDRRKRPVVHADAIAKMLGARQPVGPRETEPDTSALQAAMKGRRRGKTA